MYSVIQILIFKYVSICTRKKEHEKNIHQNGTNDSITFRYYDYR